MTNECFVYIINKAIEKIIGGGLTMKRTYQPNNRKRSKKMGFLARTKSKVVSNRRKKGRKVLAH